MKHSSCQTERDFVQLNTIFIWLRRRRLDASPESNSDETEFVQEVSFLRILGQYFKALRDGSFSWLDRRIDTIEIVNSSAKITETRTSLTIDGHALKALRTSMGIEPSSEVHLPLPAVPKQLLGDFDAEFNTHPLPVLSSLDNVHAAMGVMVVQLIELGLPIETIEPSVVNTLYTVASCKRHSALHSALWQELNRNTHDQTLELNSSATDDVEAAVDGLYDVINKLVTSATSHEVAVFCQIASDYLDNFVAVTVLNPVPLASSHVIKTRMVLTAAEPIADDSYFLQSGQQPGSRKLWSTVVVCGLSSIFLNVNDSVATVVLAVAIYGIYIVSTVGYRNRRNRNRFLGGVAYASYQDIVGRSARLHLSGCYRLISSNTNLGLFGSQHYRLAIPEGARALPHTITIDGDLEAPEVVTQVVDNWVAGYVNNQTDNESAMSVGVRVLPSSQSFLKQAFYAALLTMGLLLTGIASHFVGLATARSSGQDSEYGLIDLAARSSGSIVTIIMIAPSVYTLILLQQNEHQFVSRLLRNLRAIVGGCAVVSASSAVPIGLALSTTVTVIWWLAAFVVSLFSCWHIAATRYYHGVIAMASGDPE